MEKTIFNIFVFGLLFLWQLPQNIIGLIILLSVGFDHVLPIKRYCFSFLLNTEHIIMCMGSFFFESRKMYQDTCLFTHEIDGHATQSKILGPLYIPIVVIPFIIWRVFRDRALFPNIYELPTEEWANDIAGLDVVKIGNKYKLCYKSYVED